MRFCVILCTMLAGLIPCLATLFGIVAFYESRAVELRTAEIQNQCTILSNQLSAYGYLSDPTSEVIDSNLTQLTNIYNGRVMIMDEDLCVIKDTYNLDEGKTNVSESVVRCMRTKPTNHYDKKNHYIEVTSPINITGKNNIDGVILEIVYTDSIEVTKQVFYTHGGVVVGIAAIFLAVFGVALANKLVKPIHKITGAIENVSEGYSDDVLHVDTFAETSQLSEAFNKMLGRLKQLDDSREEFVSNVSHELKTPITIIKGQLEGMLLGIGAYKDHEKYLARSLEVAATLETMVQEILTISRLETNVDFKMEHFDCAPMIHGYLREIDDLVATKELQIHLAIQSPTFINGNKLLIEKVFSNLISNAVKYSPHGASVDIILQNTNGRFLFSVENTGTHIPEDDIPKLFDAFYRMEQSRSRRTGGSGLGLYMVQRILQQHNSYCEACNTENGVKFFFTI